MTPGQAGSSSQPAGTTSESQVVHNTYQPRTGAYPYALGTWGYHYPQFPTSIVSPSATAAGATQGDSVVNVTASGTFPYPYTAAQYVPGQPYVPPIKYPYGAPALSVSTLNASSPSAGTKPTSSTAPAEPQAQNESKPSNDGPASTQKTDEVLTSTSSNDIVPATEVPPNDKPAPTSSTESVTALKLGT